MSAQDDTDPLSSLEPLLADPEVTEIMVDGYDRVSVERRGKLEDVPTPFRDDDHLMEVIQAILTPLGRTVNESVPFEDARLPDGSRVHVVVPPISLSGPVLVIRKFWPSAWTVEDLIRFGSASEAIVEFLRASVRSRLNLVVCGGAGSGKTTVLGLLAGMIPDDERIVLVQNATEFQLRQKRAVVLETRPPNLQGRGEITLHDLVAKNALRMRPDRIIVGEVWGPEVLELMRAMNVGHDGTMFSLHASSPRDALARLEVIATAASPTLPVLAAREQMASALNLIVHLERLGDGSRKVARVTEVQGMQGDVVLLADIFVFEQTGMESDNGGKKIVGRFTATGQIPKTLKNIQATGIQLSTDFFLPRPGA